MVCWTKVATPCLPFAYRSVGASTRRYGLIPQLVTPKVKVLSMSSSTPTTAASTNDSDASVQPLMELASAHFASQSLHAFVKLGIPNVIGAGCMSVSQIVEAVESQVDADSRPRRIQINKDGLLRIMRLLATVGILHEQNHTDMNGGPYFGLTSTGALLQTNIPGQQSLAPVVFHWMEKPLWNAWAELPDYVAGIGSNVQDKGTNALPFERANGLSSDEYYCSENAESLQHANDFVRYISSGEEQAVLTGYDWASLSGKTVLDIGGHQGKIMELIAKQYPDIKCMCFDLPEVISNAVAPEAVELVGGDIFDGNLPPCDVIFMKHFLDRCMWNEEQTVKILQSCHDALPSNGQLIIAEAVLPDDAENATGTNRLHLFIDVLFLLVGRDAARTESQWTMLVEKAGLKIDRITATASPSCYMIVLSKDAY